MDKLSKGIMAIGAIIAMFSVCCADSPGMYGYYSCAAALFGVSVAVIGYIIWRKEEQRMQYKDNGDVDKRTLGKNRYLTDGQMLPTKNGFVQMTYRPVQIVNGCVSTKK